MALIKKCDVNDYFAAKRRARLHPIKPASRANATGAKQAGFAKDFLGEHTTPRKTTNPGGDTGRGAL
jgi:hypothetical protein